MNSAKNLHNEPYLILRQSSLIIVFVLLYFLGITSASGQAKNQCKEITQVINDDMGFTVTSVDIQGRWVSKELQERTEKIVGVGKPFTKLAISAAQQLISDELAKGEQFNFNIIKGSTAVQFILTDICDITDSGSSKKVKIIIRPYYIRVDLFNVGNNLLPVPRSPNSSFYNHIPKAILATSPLLGFTSDRKYGPALFLQTNTDLLHVPGFTKPGNGSKLFRLDAGVNTRKSLSDPFYTIGAGLNFIHPVYADSIIGWNIGAYYDQSMQPLGSTGEYNRKFTQLYGAIQGSLQTVFLNKYVMGGSVNFLLNRYKSLPGNDAQNTEHNYGLFAVGDGKMGKSFSRLGLWFDAGAANGNSNVQKYERIAGRLACAISLGAGHNNADLETTLGSGYTWGSPLPYNQFYAGNSSWNFLYEPINAIRNHTMPEGPVLRSLGERQGALNTAANAVGGGNFYWHFNLNFSIPVTKWSKPLIPDIIVSEETGSTLVTKLKAGIETTKSAIYVDMVKNGAPDDKSTEDAVEKIVAKDMRPAVNYVADRANIYSIKPILLFDAARMTDRVLPGKTWIGAGLGLQLNIVNARLETGYIRTLSPSQDASSGNFFLRFTLQDFY